MSALVWWMVIASVFIFGWILGARAANHRARKWALRLVNEDRQVNHPETGWHPVCEFGPTWRGELIEGIGTQPIKGVDIAHRFERADSSRFSFDGWVIIFNVPELNWWGKMVHCRHAGRDVDVIENCSFVSASATEFAQIEGPE